MQDRIMEVIRFTERQILEMQEAIDESKKEVAKGITNDEIQLYESIATLLNRAYIIAKRIKHGKNY